MSSLAPNLVRLIPDAPCHLQWHDKSADDMAPIRSRFDEICGEVVELPVGVGFAVVDVFPSGSVRRDRNRGRVHKHTHATKPSQPSRRPLSSYHNTTVRQGERLRTWNGLILARMIYGPMHLFGTAA